jgi:hypothetical protein
MESIVNPWFIYLLFKIDFIREFFGVISGMLIFVSAILVGAMCGDGDWKWKEVKKKAIAIWVSLSIILVISVMAPSKNTIIAMYVADKVTYNAVGSTVEIGKSFKEELKKDVIEIIREVTKEKENDGA